MSLWRRSGTCRPRSRARAQARAKDRARAARRGSSRPPSNWREPRSVTGVAGHIYRVALLAVLERPDPSETAACVACVSDETCGVCC